MGVYDVVVLGGGTAGTHVATEVARAGKSVALVEAGLIGGESPYLADLPVQSLLLSAARGESWADAVARRDEVTGGLSDAAAAQKLEQAGVTVIRGTGRVTAPGTVTAKDELTYTADRGASRRHGVDHGRGPQLPRPAAQADRARRRPGGM
jgi:pyruvate/2-oxoglutarate dehydrogenase complex dihydrolipoamide dehydrogenase (E3) component